MMKALRSSLILAALLWAAPSYAQSSFPTQTPGISAPGMVNMCINTAGIAVPCSLISPLGVRIVAAPPVTPYPTGAIPIVAAGSGTTGATVGTLPAFPGRTTYICGFDVSAIGGTAAVGPIIMAGPSASFTYQGSSSASGVTLSRTFTPCIPAVTLNTAITVTTTADGTATAVNVNAWGFQL